MFTWFTTSSSLFLIRGICTSSSESFFDALGSWKCGNIPESLISLTWLVDVHKLSLIWQKSGFWFWKSFGWYVYHYNEQLFFSITCLCLLKRRFMIFFLIDGANIYAISVLMPILVLWILRVYRVDTCNVNIRLHEHVNEQVK